MKTMKTMFAALMIMFVVLLVTGCGGGHDRSRPSITKEIFSDPTVDGDITLNPNTGISTVRQGFPTVFAGLNPTGPEETRAFLDFPLTSIPLDADIQLATLDIVIKSVTVLPPTATVPIRIELVDFAVPPTTLQTAFFDRGFLPPLATTFIVPAISSLDVNRSVPVDVTSLMLQAQIRGLPEFQVRILQDFPPPASPPGLIEIDEDVDPPLLIVTYF